MPLVVQIYGQNRKKRRGDDSGEEKSRCGQRKEKQDTEKVATV